MRKRNPIAVEEAFQRLSEAVAPLETEQLPLLESVNRICAQDIAATISHPPFDRAAVDGYVLHRMDVADASSEHPIHLPVVQRVYAGDSPPPYLPRGSVARIMTGAPIPAGSDSVVPQEAVTGDEDNPIFKSPVAERDNISRKGEGITEGTLLAAQGTRLGYAHIGLLASQGFLNMTVYRKPRVAVMPTGDELYPAGSPLPPGKIYDSNGALLCARLLELGCIPVPLPPVNDRLEELCLHLEKAVADGCSMLITTGGVSVGQKDLLPAAVEHLGCRILFHGIDVKPGTPALGAVLNGKPLLCLSGNPFAALVTFELLVRPLLYRMSGSTEVPKRCQATLDCTFEKTSVRRRFVRAFLSDGHVSLPDFCHSSGGLAGLTQCNCLLDIPADSPPLCSGSLVEVMLL